MRKGQRHSEETKKKQSDLKTGNKNPMYGKHRSKEEKQKMSEAQIGEKNHNFGKIFPKETIEKMSKSHEGITPSNEIRNKISELHILARNAIWYGGVKYNDPQPNKYCILWNANLRDRIRENFEHVSVLSGKTTVDNNNRKLCCHHVYYQKKACCNWDEDAQGYYCFVDGERYNIKGDPNKFVTLTNAENTMVNFDKLKWIKIFEDIIETKYNGVCFTPKKK